MTELEAYRACLIESNKVQAPALLLNDFNYLFRKAIQKYFNKKYAAFEVNQQLTDDLRVLVKTKKLTQGIRQSQEDQSGPSYKYLMPEDYVHILNCICEFRRIKPPKCEDDCPIIRQGANKLDSSKWSSVITNYYMRPSMNQPYYYISNIDEPNYNNIGTTGIDPISQLPSGVNKKRGDRYGNTTTPIMEIKCGRLNPNEYKLESVYIDYLRAPQYVELFQSDIDNPIDNTPVLEFPDYVIYEIINEIVLSMMENGSDQRIQTFPAINNTVSTQPPRS